MPSGVKIAKFVGGLIEVCFLVSFVYECGKETGRKEQQEETAQQAQDSSLIDAKDFVEMLKNVDKEVISKARFTVK